MARFGFTLLELSIVLVIIGLIIGGMTVGGEMVKQSELNRMASDFKRYHTAVHTFKLKYNQLPGDMKNATTYWPSSIAANGDGNGLIYLAGIDEPKQAWVHLSKAGIVPGDFDGTSNTPGKGFAASQRGGIYWLARNGFNVYTRNIVNAISLMGNLDGAPLMTAPEAKSVDDKYDDGNAGLGQIMTMKGEMGGSLHPDCVTGTDWLSAPPITYKLGSEAVACFLIYRLTN